MIIYKGYKEVCYVKNLAITENIVEVQAGYKTLPTPSYFYKNFLGVVIELETGYPQVNQTEAWENVEQRAKINPTNANNITCSFLDSEKLKPVKEVSRKEFKKLRNNIKNGNFNI